MLQMIGGAINIITRKKEHHFPNVERCALFGMP